MQFMVQAGIRKSLRKRVAASLQRHWINKLTLLPNVCSTLPVELGAELRLRSFSRALFRQENDDKRKRMLLNPLLRGLSRATLTDMLNCMYVRQMIPHEVLWMEGEQPCGVAFILSGSLELEGYKQDSPIALMYPGNYCGENLLVSGYEESIVTVRAHATSYVLILPRNDIVRALAASEEDTSWMVAVARVRWARFLACVRTSRGLHRLRRGRSVDSSLSSIPRHEAPGTQKAATESHRGPPAATHSSLYSSAYASRRVQSAGLFDAQVRECNVLLQGEGLPADASEGTRKAVELGKQHLSGTKRRINWSMHFVDSDEDVMAQAEALHAAAHPKSKLHVHVRGASGLRKHANTNLLESTYPLCRVCVQSTMFETRPLSNQTNVEWDETFVFKFDYDLDQHTSVELHVLDYADAHMHLIGISQAKLDIHAATKTPGAWVNLNLPIYNLRRESMGKLIVRYTYEAKPARMATNSLTCSILSFEPAAAATRSLQRKIDAIYSRIESLSAKVLFS